MVCAYVAVISSDFKLFGGFLPSPDVSKRGVTPWGTHVKRANTVSFPDAAIKLPATTTSTGAANKQHRSLTEEEKPPWSPGHNTGDRYSR